MSIKHVVKQGEHLSHIAAIHGFVDFRPIWSFPENAELKKKRKDPHILFPGDIVAIPEPRPKTVSKPAGAAHDFVLAVALIKLNLRLLDPFSKPFADESCEARRQGIDNGGNPAGLQTSKLTTDKDGKTGFEIDARTLDVEFQVFVSVPLPFPVPPPPLKEKYDLLVGSLDPISTDSGVRGRLNNLGYYAGLTNGPEDREQLFWAIEEFQFDNKIKDGRTNLPNGNFDDATNPTIIPTRKKLVEIHGDQEPV